MTCCWHTASSCGHIYYCARKCTTAFLKTRFSKPRAYRPTYFRDKNSARHKNQGKLITLLLPRTVSNAANTQCLSTGWKNADILFRQAVVLPSTAPTSGRTRALSLRSGVIVSCSFDVKVFLLRHQCCSHRAVSCRICSLVLSRCMAAVYIFFIIK